MKEVFIWLRDVVTLHAVVGLQYGFITDTQRLLIFCWMGLMSSASSHSLIFNIHIYNSVANCLGLFYLKVWVNPLFQLEFEHWTFISPIYPHGNFEIYIYIYIFNTLSIIIIIIIIIIRIRNDDEIWNTLGWALNPNPKL